MSSQDSGTMVGMLAETVDHQHEKAWWQSKKFIAFLTSQLGFFVLMGIILKFQDMDKLGDNLAFMVLAVTAGFFGVGYVLGQSYIDKYIRVAQITMGKGDPSEGAQAD